MRIEDKITIKLIKENINSFRPYKDEFINLVKEVSILKEQETKSEVVKKDENSLVDSFIGSLGQDAIEALMRTITGQILGALGIYSTGFLGRIMIKTLSGLGLKELKAWYSGESDVCGNIAKSFSASLREEITTGEAQKLIRDNLQFYLGYSDGGLVSNFVDLQVDKYVKQFIDNNGEIEKLIEQKLCNVNWMGLFKNITRFFTKS